MFELQIRMHGTLDWKTIQKGSPIRMYRLATMITEAGLLANYDHRVVSPDEKDFEKSS